MAPVLEPLDVNISKLSINTSQGASSYASRKSEPSSGTLTGPMSRLSAYSIPNTIVRDYLRKKEPIFRALDDLREQVRLYPPPPPYEMSLIVLQGWSNTEGDKHFQRLRERADSSNNNKEQQKIFWEINIRIGEELRSAGAFAIPDPLEPNPMSLHLCIAPGGYTWHLLEAYPEVTVKGITLPPHLGGHPMCIAHGDKDPRVQVKFMDLTMLAVEYGASMTEIPKEHPDAKKFSYDRPFLGETFDLVICDGQILRTHFREEYRQDREVLRLNVAQLILGMTHIKPGGTFVMLLHKADAFDNIELLQTFDEISKIKLFKPRTAHAPRSSFYLIAKDVNPTHPKAQEVVQQWKEEWKKATLAGDQGTGVSKEIPTEAKVKTVMEEFGPRLIQLAKEIWLVQKNALSRASYTKPSSPRTPTGTDPRSLYPKPGAGSATQEGRWKGSYPKVGSASATLEPAKRMPPSPNQGPEWQNPWRK